MNNEEILTREDIERLGFIYEPDETKCKTVKSGPHFDCNYFENNHWTYQSKSEVTEEYKLLVIKMVQCRYPNWKYLNSIFVIRLDKPFTEIGKGVMCRSVMAKGHI